MSPKSRFRLFSRDKGTKDDHKESKGNKDSHQQRAAVPSSASSSKNTTTISATAEGVHPSSQVSHVLADIEPQSHEQVALAIGASASSVPRPNTPISTMPPPTTALNPAATTSQIQPEQLWDRAYDDLKADESKLVIAYEKVLSRELDKDAPNSVASESQANTIEQIKPTIRRSQMGQLVKAGLKKTETEAKMKQTIGNTMHIVRSAKDIVSFAVQACPQAALAWAGVCFALQIFLNPTDESKANREGIIYIISRLDWYWELSRLLFQENIGQVDGRSFMGLRCELEKRIVDLYKTLLSYQMNSVCSYYGNRGITICRDIFKLNDWNGSLETVKDAETAFQNDSKQYNTVQIRDNLEQLVNIAEGKLRDIYSAIRRQGLRQIEREDNREDNQCLKELRLTDPTADMIRIEDTKGGLLEDSYVWILSHRGFIDWRDGDETRLLWIRGDPGKGKTMLLIGVVRELKKSIHDSELLSYFFCQGADSQLNHATAVLRGLIYQLLIQHRFLISHLREEYDTGGQQLFEDVNAFVALSKIFTKMLDDTRLTKVYLVVDALDECDSGLLSLLELIVRNVSTPSSRVKWLVSSRNQTNVVEGLTIKDSNVERSLELNGEAISGAVAAYIDHKVSELERRKGYDGKLRDQVRDRLHQKANETFLWVALVCKELGTGGIENWDVLQLLEEVPSDLTLLYARTMEQIRQLKGQNPRFCIQVLSTTTLAYRPLHLLELAALADLPNEVSGEQENLRKIVRMCGSFLTVRGDTIYFIHQSARDFLSTSGENLIFPSGRREVHRGIVSRSLQSMNAQLLRDIYDLQEPGMSIDEVNSIDPDPLAQIRYACVYWVDHLSKVDRSLREKAGLHDNGEIHRFLKNHFLHWLEALSLMRNVASGVVMIRKLEKLLAEGIDGSQLLDLVQDELRFIRHNKWVIENAPLQAYASALVFAPVRSLTRQQWKKEDPEWIVTKPIVESDWSLCLQTLEGHGQSVSSVVFSHDSRQLVSASHDRTVKIWDAATGKCLQTLEGHGDLVSGVVFSHDSRQLASASHDRTVKIWDAATGKCLQTLEGHGDSVWSVVFSHDSRQLASASLDRTVKIWDAATGKCLQMLAGHGDSVRSVVFSHDSRRLASASGDCTVKIWDAETGRCLKTLYGHGNSVWSAVFSHDSRRLASASYDCTVKIWDAQTGKCLKTLESHRHWVLSAVFSHDSRRLASASYDCTVKIWDAQTGKCLQTLEGHGDSVSSVVFAHDSRQLASASGDRTVKIWDAATGKFLQMLEGHGDWVLSVVFSHDSRQLASASGDHTVKIWDAETGKCLQTLEGHGNSIVSVVFAHDSRQLASASSDHTVKIWDAETGKCLQTLKGHGDWVRSVVFSHDLRQLVSASHDRTVKIWDAETGKCLQTLQGHGAWVWLVVFSHDSRQLASASLDRTVKIWDAATGKCLQTLEGHGDTVWSVVFSHDSRQLASASCDHTVKIWDAETGKCLQTLEGHGRSVSSVVFSHDSRQLASASDDGTVKIWDAETGKCLQTLKGLGGSKIAFDRTDSYLFTDLGIVTLAQLPSVHGIEREPGDPTMIADTAALPDGVDVGQEPRWRGYGLSSDRSWIICDGENVLWLPSEYRPGHPGQFAISGPLVGIGCRTGRVVVIRFSPAVSRRGHMIGHHEYIKSG